MRNPDSTTMIEINRHLGKFETGLAIGSGVLIGTIVCPPIAPIAASLGLAAGIGGAVLVHDREKYSRDSMKKDKK